MTILRLTDGAARIYQHAPEVFSFHYPYVLLQGIREKGRAEGEARSEVKFILSMHKKGCSLEEIADVAGKSIEEVDAVIKGLQ